MRAAGDGTVGKALDVLDQIAGFGRPVRFAELLEGSPYPKATLYRFVQTLTNQNMLRFDPERQTYAMGLRLVRLAHSAWEQSSLAPIARPHVDAVAEELGETIHLAQLDSGHVLYVDKRSPARAIPMYSDAGKIGPVYCTGVGKTMLAFLPDDQAEGVIAQQSFHVFTPQTLATPDALRAELCAIRTRGYGFDREEHEPGIICLAHPILTEAGTLIGALSVTSTTQRETLSGLERHAPRLAAAASAIAQDAAGWSFPVTPPAQNGASHGTSSSQ